MKLNAQFLKIVKPAAYLATRSTGSATEQPQKKGLRPAPCPTEIKHVENVSLVSTCLSVGPAVSVPNFVENPPVGAGCKGFGKHGSTGVQILLWS